MGLSCRRALALAGSAACVAAATIPFPAQAVPAARPAPAARAVPADQVAAAAQTAPVTPRWSIFKILNEKRFDTLQTLAAVGKHDAWAFGQTSWAVASPFTGPGRPGPDRASPAPLPGLASVQLAGTTMSGPAEASARQARTGGV